VNNLIIKEQKKSSELLKLEAIVNRLRKSHSSYPILEKDYAKKLAGYKGEKSIAYYLSYINDNYLIFNNIRLKDKNHFFQIDTLIASPFFICNLEVKNIAGTLYFDEEYDQMIRTLGGKEEGFPSPLIQIRRQQSHLENWLEDHKFPRIPCQSFVVISNPSTIIKASKSLKSQILHSANIPFKIGVLEKKFKEQLLTKSSLKKLSKTLIEKHIEEGVDLFTQYSISKNDILTGVQCPDCGQFPAKRVQGSWRCSICKHKAKDAHFKTLEEYKYLFGNKITNQQLRSFLHISSRTSATKFFSTLNYVHEGKTKDRVYFIP
jgi:ribosomal protein L37AE/L43A